MELVDIQNKYYKEIRKIKKFPEDLYVILEDYKKNLKSLKIVTSGGISLNITDSMIKEIQSNKDILCHKNNGIIERRLKGNIFGCYKSMSNWLKNNKLKIYSFKSSFKSFYRIRVLSDTNRGILERKDIFHVPFSICEKLKNNRFSISGYPCLYLSTNLKTCWEEHRKPRLDLICASSFKYEDKKDLMLFDLRYWMIPQSQKELGNYLKLLPLIMACYIKPKASEAYFIPEYIIPQVFLHSILLNKDVDGIVYNSVMSKGENIVLPTIEKTENYCEKLCLKFKLTEPTLFSEVQENCMDRLLKGDKVLQVYQDYLDSKEFDLI